MFWDPSLGREKYSVWPILTDSNFRRLRGGGRLDIFDTSKIRIRTCKTVSGVAPIQAAKPALAMEQATAPPLNQSNCITNKGVNRRTTNFSLTSSFCGRDSTTSFEQHPNGLRIWVKCNLYREKIWLTAAVNKNVSTDFSGSSLRNYNRRSGNLMEN